MLNVAWPVTNKMFQMFLVGFFFFFPHKKYIQQETKKEARPSSVKRTKQRPSHTHRNLSVQTIKGECSYEKKSRLMFSFSAGFFYRFLHKRNTSNSTKLWKCSDPTSQKATDIISFCFWQSAKLFVYWFCFSKKNIINRQLFFAKLVENSISVSFRLNSDVAFQILCFFTFSIIYLSKLYQHRYQKRVVERTGMKPVQKIKRRKWD